MRISRIINAHDWKQALGELMSLIAGILRASGIGLILLVFLQSGPAHSAEPSKSCQASVSLPETVELALVIAGVSQLGRDSNNVINRDSPYFAAVDRHFGEHADHPLFAALGDEFNLPRLAGNAADFEFDEHDQLVEVDASGSLWLDAENDLFRRHAILIGDFSTATNFREFFAKHRSTYRELVDRTAAATDIEGMRCWLESKFTANPGRTRVYVSPLIAYLHWTTLYKPEHRIWVIAAPDQALDNDLAAMRYARAIFTELDHPFVNPVTAKHTRAVESAFEQSEIWVTKNAANYYPSAELQFNEYMTFAVFLMFADDHLAPADFARLREEVVTMMVERRGFLAFAAFSDEALTRYRNDSANAETLIPLLIQWSAAYGGQ